MTLTDIKGVGPKLAATLGHDKWTVEAIATTTPYQLQKYSGVSYKAAQGFIKDAQRLVNEKGLEESFIAPMETQPGDLPPASARVKRIRGEMVLD